MSNRISTLQLDSKINEYIVEGTPFTVIGNTLYFFPNTTTYKIRVGYVDDYIPDGYYNYIGYFKDSYSDILFVFSSLFDVK